MLRRIASSAAGTPRSLDLKLGNAKALTVLGNIVARPIMINGATLGAPWQPLNVIENLTKTRTHFGGVIMNIAEL